MVDMSYAYANSRIKIMKTTLLPEQTLQQMLTVSTFDEVIELLEEGPYKNAFVEASTKYSGRALILRALALDFSRTVDKLWKLVPYSGRHALHSLLRAGEIQTIELAISSKAAGIPLSPDELIFMDQQRLKKLQAFADAPTVEAAIGELSKTEYGPIVSAARGEYEKTKDHRAIVNALDEHYYSTLASSLASLADFGGKRLIKSDIDAHNYMIALRMKHSHAQKRKAEPSPEEIEKMFIKGGNLEFAIQIARAPNYDSALKLLEEKYSMQAAAKATKEQDSLAPMEIALNKNLSENAAKAIKSSVLSFGAIMAYLHLKQKEILLVRAITFAANLGLATEMKKMIFEEAATAKA